MGLITKHGKVSRTLLLCDRCDHEVASATSRRGATRYYASLRRLCKQAGG